MLLNEAPGRRRARAERAAAVTEGAASPDVETPAADPADAVIEPNGAEQLEAELSATESPDDQAEDDEAAQAARAPGRFRTWRRERPFVGGLLVALGGVELFFSGQLDIGHLHVQMGIEGLQATIIPVVLVLLGVLAMLMPAHHVFYGVIALALAVYALIGVNLGGFLIGTILACIGGILVVAWMTPEARAAEKADKAERRRARSEESAEETA